MSPPNEKRRPGEGRRSSQSTLAAGSTAPTVQPVGAYPLDGVDDLERFMSLARYAKSVEDVAEIVLARHLTERGLMQLATYCMRLAGAASTLASLAERDLELKSMWLAMRGERRAEAA